MRENHYIIIRDWANDGMCDSGVSIIEVTHSQVEAKKIFSEEVIRERDIANENGWEIIENTETEFDAGESGSYNIAHTHLYIEKVDSKGFICRL